MMMIQLLLMKRLSSLAFVLIITCSMIMMVQIIIMTVSNRKIYSIKDSVQSQIESKYRNLPALEPIRQIPSGFRFFDIDNIYLDKYKLHYCNIDKNMGSTMQALLCYIDDPLKYQKFFFTQLWTAGLDNHECGRSVNNGQLQHRFLTAASNPNFFEKSSTIYHLAIIRHPLSRFMSAFLMFCRNYPRPINISKKINIHIQKPNSSQFERIIPDDNTFRRPQRQMCYGCGTNVACFLPQLYHDILMLSRNLNADRWPSDYHFFPQSWNCDFNNNRQQYHLLVYNRTDDRYWQQLIETFTKIGIDKRTIWTINTQIHSKSIPHATYRKSAQLERRIRSDPILIEYIYKIYYLDFLWFNFNLE